MRNHSCVAAVLIIFIFCATALPQTAAEELARLRRHLDIPEGTKIIVGMPAVIPSASPLKVFLAVGLDTKVRDNYGRWFKKWNAKEGKKHGRIDLIDEMSKADVILARYVLRDRVSTATDPGKWYEMPREVNVSPAYSYMMVPTSSDFTIIWRDTGTAYTTDSNRSGEIMAKQLMKMLRVRGEK
jgi:hypothetical protein